MVVLWFHFPFIASYTSTSNVAERNRIGFYCDFHDHDNFCKCSINLGLKDNIPKDTHGNGIHRNKTILFELKKKTYLKKYSSVNLKKCLMANCFLQIILQAADAKFREVRKA